MILFWSLIASTLTTDRNIVQVLTKGGSPSPFNSDQIVLNFYVVLKNGKFRVGALRPALLMQHSRCYHYGKSATALPRKLATVTFLKSTWPQMRQMVVGLFSSLVWPPGVACSISGRGSITNGSKSSSFGSVIRRGAWKQVIIQVKYS